MLRSLTGPVALPRHASGATQLGSTKLRARGQRLRGMNGKTAAEETTKADASVSEIEGLELDFKPKREGRQVYRTQLASISV